MRHNTVVTRHSSPLRVSAAIAVLDALELLRHGTVPAVPADGPAGTVSVELPPVDEGTAELVDLTDLEGVPVARLPLVREGGTVRAQGIPQWLSERSSRPFERFHRGPQDLPHPTGVVTLTGPVPADELAEAVAGCGPDPLLLVLASLDGDVDSSGLAAARQAADLHEDTGITVVLSPAPDLLGADAGALVAQGYAAGAPVHHLASTPVPGTSGAGVVLFLTGLSGSGKSTVAREVRNRLLEGGEQVSLLDGDVVRQHLSTGLGFSRADRDTNIRRIGWVAAEVAHHGGTAICSPIAPFDATRKAVRAMVESRGGRFVLVHVSTPLEECERRDRKGLYAAARRGEIPDFTGISSPYEEPQDADLVIDTTGRDVGELATAVLDLL